VKRAPAAFALLIASSCVAQAQDFDCSNPDDLPQQGMNFCSAAEFEAADAELNEVWADLRRTLKQRETEYEGYEGWFETALAGQRAWITYRDAQCEAEGMAAEGGSMQPLLVSGCLVRLTEARVVELREMMAVE
jgi:uncharacterized protein YecT (DUF1311 family)